MKKTTAIVNHKGGVGKTGIATNLAFELATVHNSKTLLVDLDPQGHSSVTYCLEIDDDKNVSQVIRDRAFKIENAIKKAVVSGEVVDNLYILPSTLDLEETGVDIFGRTRFEKLLSKQLEKIYDNFDYIIIDCPPNLGPLTQNGVFAADSIMIPVEYDTFSLRGVVTIVKKIHEVKEDQEEYEYKILRNMKDLRNRKIVYKVEAILKDNLDKDIVMDTTLRYGAVMKNARESREPIRVYDAKSKLNNDFHNLMLEYVGETSAIKTSINNPLEIKDNVED